MAEYPVRPIYPVGPTTPIETSASNLSTEAAEAITIDLIRGKSVKTSVCNKIT